MIFLIFNAKDSRDITITVGAGENKFKLNFDIPQEKQPKLDHLLDKLALPLSIKNGFEFGKIISIIRCRQAGEILKLIRLSKNSGLIFMLN